MKKYFAFTRKDKIGVISLSLIILILVFAIKVYSGGQSNYKLDTDTTGIEYISWKEQKFEDERIEDETDFDQVHYSDFNPNDLSLNEWIEFGFSEKQAQSIINYKNKYGDFEFKEDLKNLYVVSEEKYSELEPYILLPNKSSNHPGKEIETNQAFVETEPLNIDLNRCSAQELTQIRGIGDKYAERIIKYRKQLGGFTDTLQFNEIWGLSDFAKLALRENTFIDPTGIEKFNINQIEKSRLDDHPYLDWSAVAAIVKERDQRKIENLDFLIAKKVISETDKTKLLPYITFE